MFMTRTANMLTQSQSIDKNDSGNYRPEARIHEREPDTSTYPQERLGYDWIVGMLDNSKCLFEKPDSYFDQIHTFRKLNRRKCMSETDIDRSYPSELLQKRSDIRDYPKEVFKNFGESKDRFLVDSRGFFQQHSIDTPLYPGHRFSQEPEKSQKYVRISVPNSEDRFPRDKHQKLSKFDPIDSVDIKQHCKFGWTGTNHVPIKSSSSYRQKRENSDLKSHIDPEAVLAGRLDLATLHDPSLNLMLKNPDIRGTGYSHNRTRRLLNSCYSQVYDKYRNGIDKEYCDS